MGSVWLAEHIELGTRVAVKLMDPGLAANPEGIGRFKREAQAAANLDSPNIVRVFDYGIDSGNPYIAMELLKGESLAERLARLGRIDAASMANIYMQVGKAITKAHEAGIVHRDLKPDNIFLVADDDGDLAKVIDFGIAKRTSLVPGPLSAVQTQTGAMLGTPYYMSPEQASGSKNIDYRTDIWSLGIIAFECITGQRPYESDSLGALVLAICTGEPRVPSRYAPVPAGFDGWFARCAARDPTDRFQSTREAAAALWSVCTSAGDLSAFDRVSAAPAMSRGTSAVEAATSPRSDLATPNQRAALTQAGAVALTISGLKKPPNKSRFVMLIGLTGLVLVGAVTALGAWLRLDAPSKHDAGQPTALAGSTAAMSEPTITAMVVPAPLAVNPKVDASAAAPPAIVAPITERASAPAVKTSPVAQPNTPTSPKVAPPKTPTVNAPTPVAAAPVAVVPAEKPAPAAVTAPPKPANPFATRQ
jgi:eukaryotic-like serine/threonine-protein kinase